MGSLRILIVDDHEAVRNGIRSLLSSRPDWVVCGEAKDGIEAVEKAKHLRSDIVLMDISMPRMTVSRQPEFSAEKSPNPK
jgi:DNA-binding NarL/FixJ family response regulator